MFFADQSLLRKYVNWFSLAALLLLVLAINALPGNQTVLAAEEISIKQLQISIWPEYDNPRILVMYEGELASGVSFPQEIEVYLPKGVEINQVCALQPPSGEHLCQDYKIAEGPDSQSVIYTLPIPNFFLEYYYDGLTGEVEKTFTYQFQSKYPIEQLRVEVQQPLKASNFSLLPRASGSNMDNQGFQYHYYTYDSVAAGEVISINANYKKSDSRPSVAAAKTENSPFLPIFFTAAGLAALAVAWKLWLSPRRRTARVTAAPRASRQNRKPHHKNDQLPSAQQSSARDRFCTQCGLAIEKTDKYCAQCGAKLRQ